MVIAHHMHIYCTYNSLCLRVRCRILMLHPVPWAVQLMCNYPSCLSTAYYLHVQLTCKYD